MESELQNDRSGTFATLEEWQRPDGRGPRDDGIVPIPPRGSYKDPSPQAEAKRARSRERYYKKRDQILAKMREKRANQTDYGAAYYKRVKATVRYKNAAWASQMKRKYGLTPQVYFDMLAAQGGGCAVCGSATPGVQPGPEGKRRPYFSVDHCHKTGKIRGLVCFKCNVGMGSFGDDPDAMDQASAYLRRHQ